jgi:hypothetical protein
LKEGNDAKWTVWDQTGDLQTNTAGTKGNKQRTEKLKFMGSDRKPPGIFKLSYIGVHCMGNSPVPRGVFRVMSANTSQHQIWTRKLKVKLSLCLSKHQAVET